MTRVRRAYPNPLSTGIAFEFFEFAFGPEDSACIPVANIYVASSAATAAGSL